MRRRYLVDNAHRFRTVRRMKLLSILTIAAFAALTLPGVAAADPVVDEHGCPEGTTWTETAGVPLCLAPIWLDGTWADDPRSCTHGYYQGSCAPVPAEPEVLPVEAYTYQMDEPDPEYVAAVEAKRIVWLTAAELELADVGTAR